MVAIQDALRGNPVGPAGGAGNVARGNVANWRLDTNHWDIYDSGGDVNRHLVFQNLNAAHVGQITLTGYRNGNFSVLLDATIWRPSARFFNEVHYSDEQSQQLANALRARGFTENSPNVTNFPRNMGTSHFTFMGTLDEINHALDSILQVVKDLEGPRCLDTIETQIRTAFTAQRLSMRHP